jgi:hypothetical protein
VFPAPSMPDHVRLRISPDVTTAFGMMVKLPCDEMLGEPIEMVARQEPWPEDMEVYERVLHDAMAVMPRCSPARTTSRKPGESSIWSSRQTLRCTSTSRARGDLLKWQRGSCPRMGGTTP